MVTAELQSRRECMYTIRLIFPGAYLLGIKLLDIRSLNLGGNSTVEDINFN